MRAFGLLLAGIPDPRAANARHDFSELLFIAFTAVLCGAQSCQDMADFGRAKEPALRKFLRLRHGIASHDTFCRLFRLLDAAAFEAAFRRFTAAFATWMSGQVGTAGQVIAIDGKAIRAAFDAATDATPLRMVTAWSTDQRLVLAQRRSPGGNEVAGALEVIGLLDLQATTVTADALHGNRKMASAILARGGDYVLAVKGNQGPLFSHVKDVLTRVRGKRRRVTRPAKVGAGQGKLAHGRREVRKATVVTVPESDARRFAFPGLKAVARIDTTRRVGKQEQQLSRYFLLSRVLAPEQALATVRAHWGIENQQHWILDVAFNEDRARARKDNACENLALLRSLALNVLQHDNYKASIRRKINRACWEDTYLFGLIAQMR